MKISAIQKMFGSAMAEVKDFYSNEFVKIAKSYKDDSVSNALYRLEPVKDVFESYAKKECVSLSIGRASDLLTEKTETRPSLKNLFDRSIVLNVTNNITGVESRAIIDTSKETFVHSGEKYMTLPKKDRAAISVLAHYSHEDNLIRAAYRTFERLTKLVKK